MGDKFLDVTSMGNWSWAETSMVAVLVVIAVLTMRSIIERGGDDLRQGRRVPQGGLRSALALWPHDGSVDPRFLITGSVENL